MTQDIPGTESAFPLRLHAKPICRWVGGKRWMLRTLSNVAYVHLQRTRGHYVEPFLGGGAVALDLGLPNMILADTCEPLIHAYDQVRRFPQQVAWMLATYEKRGVDKDTYMDVRDESPMSHIQRAAHFLYLNALCFNGVWRVNSDGVFNVAYGSKGSGAPAGKMRTTADLEQFAAAIKTSTLTAADFHKTLEHAGEGDFIYADPPYFNTYDDYTTGRFTAKDHVDLSEALRAAYDRGADLVTTNMDTPEVREMYAWAAIQVTGEMHRVCRDPAKRGKMSTVLISTIPDLVGVEV